MAIESARETNARLVVVNVRVVPIAPLSRNLLGVEGLTLPHEEALDEVRATAARAAGEGVDTLLLRVGTRHPARALLEVVREQDAGLLVLAPRSGRHRAARAAPARAPRVRARGMPRLGRAGRPGGQPPRAPVEPGGRIRPLGGSAECRRRCGAASPSGG